MQSLASVSLRNRAFIVLVAATVAVLGVFAATNLKQELIPSITLPQVTVVAQEPGASAQQMHDTIAEPIEEQFRTIDDAKSTSSTSNSSVTTVTLELDYGADTARAASQADAALAELEDSFPDGTTTQVIAGGSSEIPAVMLAVSGDLDAAELSSRVDSAVIPRIQRLDGVASAQVIGAPTKIVRITPDEGRLSEHGLAVSDITTALDNSGMSVPGTQVTQDNKAFDVTIGQGLSTVDDLKAIEVLPSADGSSATLGDVSTVEIADQAAASVSRTNGKNSLVIMVMPTADGNVVDISKGVKDTTEDLAASVGGDVSFTTVFDQAPFIQQSIESLATEGGLGLVMAVIVILIFLLALRPTLVTALSIPLSILMALVGMLVFGYSLNLLTLAALTMTIGRVVDDSIVVIENITRHLREAEAERGAAVHGGERRHVIEGAVTEVAAAVASSTFATAIVFLPLALVTGTAGELFRPFALTVVIAMLSSLIVALTIVPVLAYWFLRTGRRAERRLAAGKQRNAAPREPWSARIYRPILRVTQRHRITTLVVAVVILGASIAPLQSIKVNFLDAAGQNLAQVTQTLPAGTKLDQSTEMAAKAEKAMAKVDGVETIETIIGGQSAGATSSAPNQITYAITTAEDADQETLTTKLYKAIKAIPGSGQVGGGDISGLGGSSTVDVAITGPDDDSRSKAAEQIVKALADVDTVSRVATDLQVEQPTLEISVKRDVAARMGLSENDVVGMITSAISNRSTGTVKIDGTDLDIYIAGDDSVDTVSDVKKAVVGGIPLVQLADISAVKAVPTVTTQDGQETVTVSATPKDSENVNATSMDVRSAVDGLELPDGVTTEMGGASTDISDSFGQLGIAMLAAILLIYLLLVWIFKSLAQPLILLVSIPFAATGAILMLVGTGTPLGLPAMIGVLMLIGIVVTNAIVLVDLINQYRRAGMGLEEAIELGAGRRLRPIVMTALATIFALTPMAIGVTGHSGFISAPMAIVTIGGLFTSTLMTLLIVPVLYRIIEGVKLAHRRRRQQRRGQEPRREPDQEPRHGHGGDVGDHPTGRHMGPQGPLPKIEE